MNEDSRTRWAYDLPHDPHDCPDCAYYVAVREANEVQS